MFEKFKARFDTQKSDDAFVEAAINATARQELIEKLVKTRTKFNRIAIFIALVFGFNLLTSLLAPSATAHSQNVSIINLVMMAMLFSMMFVMQTVIDWQVKYFKALEAGAQQVSQTVN